MTYGKEILMFSLSNKQALKGQLFSPEIKKSSIFFISYNQQLHGKESKNMVFN